MQNARFILLFKAKPAQAKFINKIAKGRICKFRKIVKFRKIRMAKNVQKQK